MRSEVLIVGGGPAGSVTGIVLGDEHEILIAEEHPISGFPTQCAGLISNDCLNLYKKLKIKVKKLVENKVSGAFIFSPDGNFIEARGKAYVIERKMLDQELLAKASENAKILLKSMVKFEGSKAIIRGNEVSYEYLIGADGANSAVARSFGFMRPELFPALQIETRFDMLDEKFVEIYFGKHYSDILFAYSIPIGDTAKIGVIARNSPVTFLKKLIESHPSVSNRVKSGILELVVGSIPDRLVPFSKDRVALVGDSAGMVKPHTGGGLYYLALAAKKLKENFPNFRRYEKAYRLELFREYKIGLMIREMYSRLTDDEFNEIIKLLNDFNFGRVRMDYPSTLFNFEVGIQFLAKIAKNPKLFGKVFGKILTILHNDYLRSILELPF